MLTFTHIIVGEAVPSRQLAGLDADADADADKAGANARADTVTLWLTHDERARSRHVCMMADGTPVAVVLPRGTVLRDGTCLGNDDGGRAVIRAAAQAVLRIGAVSPQALLQLVYHLANRHVAMQIAADHILIEPDPVLQRLAIALGAAVQAVHLPFEPEAGAYRAHAHEPVPAALGTSRAHAHVGAQAPAAIEAAGSAATASPSHHHGLSAEDAAAGAIGERLSIEAHALNRIPALAPT